MTNSVYHLFDRVGEALSAQKTRLDVVSSNLANAETTRTPEGGPYRRLDVVLSATDMNFGDFLRDGLHGSARTVEVAEIRPDPSPPRLVYDPSHPDANKEGYVAYPNINSVEEMVNMITAMRTYQANLNAFSTLRDMADRALNMGRLV